MNPMPRAWAEIHLDAIRRNAGAVRALLPAGCRLLIPMKTDAYGHGAVEAGRALAPLADMFAVSTLDEAAVLRKAGVNLPLLLLSSPFVEEFPALKDLDVTPSLSESEAMRKLAEWLRKRGERMKVHVKVDTGMGRLGLPWAEARDSVMEALRCPEFEVEGVYSHLSSADEADDSRSPAQLARFRELLAYVEGQGFHVTVPHILNSPGLQRYPEACFGMVRAGGLVYGMNLLPPALRRVDVEEAFSVKARVLAVKEIARGESVGYGATFRAERDMRIAVIAAGYGDGLFRAAGARVPVLLGGKKRFLAGRVSMNACAAALEDGDAVRPGDSAVFLGQDGTAHISLEEIARSWGTISYEAACHLGRMLPRRYIRAESRR